MRITFSVFFHFLLAIIFFSSTAMAAETPPIVKKHFETYSALHPKAKPQSSDETNEQVFARYFFMGLTRPKEVWTSKGIESDAFNQGQAYWNDNPKERELILSSYGYVRVDVEGTWRCGFEQSSFSPKGRKKEEWWVSSFRGASWGNLLDTNCKKVTSVRIVGYVSPIGNYGHLGSYQREIFFTSFTRPSR